MLVVKLKQGERVQVGEATVTVLEPRRDGKVRLGIVAPQDVKIRRLDVSKSIGAEQDDGEFSRGIL